MTCLVRHEWCAIAAISFLHVGSPFTDLCFIWFAETHVWRSAPAACLPLEIAHSKADVLALQPWNTWHLRIDIYGQVYWNSSKFSRLCEAYLDRQSSLHLLVVGCLSIRLQNDKTPNSGGRVILLSIHRIVGALLEETGSKADSWLQSNFEDSRCASYTAWKERVAKLVSQILTGDSEMNMDRRPRLKVSGI